MKKTGSFIAGTTRGQRSRHPAPPRASRPGFRLGWARTWAMLLVLLLILPGCGLELIPVGIVERIESVKPRPATRPWHFEGERVVYELPR